MFSVDLFFCNLTLEILKGDGEQAVGLLHLSIPWGCSQRLRARGLLLGVHASALCTVSPALHRDLLTLAEAMLWRLGITSHTLFQSKLIAFLCID